MSARADKEVELFGLCFWAVEQAMAARIIAEAAAARRRGLVVTPNVDHIVTVHQDQLAREVYQSAAWVFADGMPIVWLSRMGNGPGLPARVTGADLLLDVAALAPAYGLRVYFCGGMPGVAEQLVARLKHSIVGLNVVGIDSPPLGFERDPAETARVIERCNAVRPDVLYLGFGTPKQEIWAYQHLSRLDVGPVLCVGGAFDMAAGLKRRAPRLLRNWGLEWAWRLALEPGRLGRRYLVRDAQFLSLAWHELRRRGRKAEREER